MRMARTVGCLSAMAAGAAGGAWLTGGAARIVLSILSAPLVGLALWTSLLLSIVLLLLLFDHSHRRAPHGRGSRH
jgi:hypothetical protein